MGKMNSPLPVPPPNFPASKPSSYRTLVSMNPIGIDKTPTYFPLPPDPSPLTAVAYLQKDGRNNDGQRAGDVVMGAAPRRTGVSSKSFQRGTVAIGRGLNETNDQSVACSPEEAVRIEYRWTLSAYRGWSSQQSLRRPVVPSSHHLFRQIRHHLLCVFCAGMHSRFQDRSFLSFSGPRLRIPCVSGKTLLPSLSCSRSLLLSRLVYLVHQLFISIESETLTVHLLRCPCGFGFDVFGAAVILKSGGDVFLGTFSILLTSAVSLSSYFRGHIRSHPDRPTSIVFHPFFCIWPHWAPSRSCGYLVASYATEIDTAEANEGTENTPCD